jgi:ankyrin repeat protein
VNHSRQIRSIFILFVILSCLSFSALAKNPDLVNAVKESNLASVKKYLKTKKDANLLDNKNPLLYVSLVNGSIEIAELLIKKGADPNASNQYGAPVLITAAGSGYDTVVNKLLEKGAKINARFERYDNVTALMLAAQDGHTSTVDVLLKKGADVNAETSTGDTALIAASAKGHLHIVKQLLANGANINVRSETGYTALFIAISENDVKLVELLLAKGADPNITDDNKDTALKLANRIESTDIIKLIKKAGGK